MTLRYTNAEWEEFIQQTVDGVDVSQYPYPCPDIGSPGFMKTMDHTLLKLDARPSQFDDLCAEARVNSFAVCQMSHAVYSRGDTDICHGLDSVCSSEYGPAMRIRSQGFRRKGSVRDWIPRRDV
jgi:hypothetical protein